MLMQFGGFVFKENPVKINIKYGRNLNMVNITGCGSIILNRGKTPRVAEGEGVIVGRNTLRKFTELMAVFDESEESKMLVLPNGETFWSFFSKLSMVGEGDVEKIRYSFEFVEDCVKGWQDG
ncbi:MAG: hypothetical protein LBJ83_01010 [Oscillospiraceae bacterium]|jgi:hypothetical protein|nr:hypothetical protein [Oscillospiraceae bacterium]